MRRPPEVLEVWPEHHATWDTWRAMETQWQVAIGLRGAHYLGLVYASIPEALEMADVPEEERRPVRKNLRFMEAVAVPILNGVDEDE